MVSVRRFFSRILIRKKQKSEPDTPSDQIRSRTVATDTAERTDTPSSSTALPRSREIVTTRDWWLRRRPIREDSYPPLSDSENSVWLPLPSGGGESLEGLLDGNLVDSLQTNDPINDASSGVHDDHDPTLETETPLPTDEEMSNHEKELPPLPAIVIGSTDASAVSLPVPDEGLSRGLGVPPVESPYLSVRSFGTPSPMFGNSAVSSTNATSLEGHGAKDVPVAVPMSEAPRSPRPAHAQPPQVPVLSAQQNVSKMDGVPSAPPGLPRKRLQPPSLLMNGGTGYHQPPPSPAPSRQNPIPLSDSTTEPLNLAPRELPDWDGRPQFTDGRFTYVFLSKLGTGGSAAVYAARVIPNELASIKIGFPLYVAVKVFWKAALELVRSDFKTAVSEKKILRELAENTLSLHTSKLLSSFQTERWLLFVMELHSGTSGYLAQFNHDNGPIMGMRNVLRYAAELLVGVEEFHNLGVVHGDLKPENILLTTSGHLVVSDFGSAYQHPEGRRAQLWNATATGSFPFTTCYAAPEVLDLSQFQATGYTSQVDLWSCGVIIAEWSLGLPKNVSLFDNYFDTRGSTSPSSKMLEHLETWEWETDHRGFSCIPFHLNDLLSKLLRKDPKERITLPEAMAHPFFADIDWNAIRSRRWEAPVSRELPTRMLSCRMEDLVNQRKLKSYDPMPDDIDWSVFNWPGIH